MDQNNGLEAKTSKEKTGTTLTIDFRDIPRLFIGISLPDQTSHLGTTIRTNGELMINAQINHSIEAMEIDPDTNPSTIRMKTGEPMEDFFVPHSSKEETSRKTFHAAKQEMINQTILPSAHLKIDQRKLLRLTNKKFYKKLPNFI